MNPKFRWTAFFFALLVRAAEPRDIPATVAPIAVSAVAGPVNETKPASPQPSVDSSPAPAKPIVHDGQSFELASSAATKSVETDEYTTAGEKLGAWTQLVTVQRLTTAKPTTAMAFVAYVKQRVAEDGASLEVLSEAKNASVFAVRFPRSEKNEEQVMICLAFSDPAGAERMNVVQYAVKPAQCPSDTAANRVRSWRDKFLAQARLLASAAN